MARRWRPAPDIYRALIEATAYGTRVIIEALTENGVPVIASLPPVACPRRTSMLMQIYADVTAREFRVVRSSTGPAPGSAMHGAVAAGVDAGGYADIFEASANMGGLKDVVFRPIPENMRRLRPPVRRLPAPPRLLRPR